MNDSVYAGGLLIAGPGRGDRVYAGGKRAVGTPYVSITTEYNGTFSATLKGASGSVFFDWGGGEYEEFVLTTGGVACTHVYSDASSKVIKIYGALSSVTYLDASMMSITAISSFAGLANLTDLRLFNNSIVDISPVAGLANLTYLRLFNNSIVDISPVAGLANLTYLHLFNNSIVDISPVAGLANLTYLYLYNNSIVDISPVAGLANLTYLRLGVNTVTYPVGGISWPAWGGTEYRLDSTVTTAAEVDQMLIDFAAGGMNNCQLNVAGTNPARTSASDAAMGTLIITNNVTVTVNP